MANTITFGLISLGIGILFSIPALVLGHWLKKVHDIPNRFLLSLLFCVVLVFVKRIWLPDLSYYWLALIIVAGSTVGVYRMDIYWAITQPKQQQ
jgi:hypothetical protein